MSRRGRYEEMFDRLRRAGEGAFVPYLTLGDPDPDVSADLADCLIAAGADALEVGIPFSDPIADGPVIQAAARRALAAGTTPEGAFETVEEIRGRHPDVPIGLLVYANLVVEGGIDAFFDRVARAGIDSVLVADVPTLESGPFAESASGAGVDLVMIVPPNASEEAVRTVASRASGYVYVVTREGPTGDERAARPDRQPHLGLLRELGAPPPLVGFGISRPKHVRNALRAGAAGAITGSAVVRRIEANWPDTGAVFDALESFVGEMKRATRGVSAVAPGGET